MLAQNLFAIAPFLDQAVLWFLILLSLASVAMILERWVSLRKISAESEKVRAKVRNALQSNSVQDFEDIGRDPSSLEGRVSGYALRHIKDSGSKGVEEIFNTFTLTERPELEKSLNYLATIGSNAPYVGLFGTVLGIMKSFNDLATASEAGQQTVMAGISSALVATAAGLFVAIPAVIFYNHFSKQVRGILQSIDSVKELCLAYSKKKGI